MTTHGDSVRAVTAAMETIDQARAKCEQSWEAFLDALEPRLPERERGPLMEAARLIRNDHLGMFGSLVKLIELTAVAEATMTKVETALLEGPS